MSVIKVSGNTGGTGIFHLRAPNSSTDRFIDLPDNTGTFLTTESTVLPKVPMFQVKLGSNQTVSSGVNTKVQFDTEEYDTNNFFDSTTNYRLQPTIAGHYHISGGLFVDVSGSTFTNLVTASVYFNGSSGNLGAGRIFLRNGGSGIESEAGGSFSYTVYFNGSSDYLEVFGYITGGGTRSFLGSSTYKASYLNGFLLREGSI